MLYRIKFRIKSTIILLLSLGLLACGSQLGTTPTPPGKVGKVIGKIPNNANTAPLREPLVSIMSHTSGIITVWATAPNNWLWGYSPFDSQSFGDLRNWYLLKNSNGSISFRNLATDTCIAAHKNSGIVHLACDRNSLAQQFDLLPLTNRAVAIKNVANGLCLTTPLFRSTVYMPLLFANCVKAGEMTQDQQWFITPPIQPSFPIPLAR